MTRALLVVLVLAGAARAESIIAVDPQRTTWDRLGTSMRFGMQPIDGEAMTTMSLGVLIDRPLHGDLRALIEYEHLWLGAYDLEDDVGVASLADSGHRAQLGLRRELDEMRYVIERVRLFVDGEAGAGAMLVDRMTGSALAVGHVFLGLRAGAAVFSDGRRKRWDYELVARGLVTSEGLGVVFGIGLVWGE